VFPSGAAGRTVSVSPASRELVLEYARAGHVAGQEPGLPRGVGRGPGLPPVPTLSESAPESNPLLH